MLVEVLTPNSMLFVLIAEFARQEPATAEKHSNSILDGMKLPKVAKASFTENRP